LAGQKHLKYLRAGRKEVNGIRYHQRGYGKRLVMGLPDLKMSVNILTVLNEIQFEHSFKNEDF
jgi:hypothetical protein